MSRLKTLGIGVGAVGALFLMGSGSAWLWASSQVDAVFDKGDPTIRDRVIFKALSVIEASIKLPPFDDELLQDWFERNRAKYDEPARYDFHEAVLPGAPVHGELEALAVLLNAGESAQSGESEASLRVFTGRPYSNIVQSYGAAFAQALETSPPGEWRVLESEDGPRLMQLRAIAPPRRPPRHQSQRLQRLHPTPRL